jgi:hypothetical protein
VMEVVTKGVMYRTRKRWKEIMSERLVIVKETVIRDDHSGKVIRELEEAGLISRHYDTSCLAVDVWYIFDRRPVYAHKRFEQINSVRDPFNRLFFGITIQAIYDVKCHRPCDANSWIIDIPPGNDSSTHLRSTCKEVYIRNSRLFRISFRFTSGDNRRNSRQKKWLLAKPFFRNTQL